MSDASRAGQVSQTASRMYLVVGLFIAIIFAWSSSSTCRWTPPSPSGSTWAGRALGEGAEGRDPPPRALRGLPRRGGLSGLPAAHRGPAGRPDRPPRAPAQQPDLEVARKGFLQGRNHPIDIEYAMTFFRRFQHTAYMSRVIEHWTRADELVAELVRVAEAMHEATALGRITPETTRAFIARLDVINAEVAIEEDQFSFTLAEASRWANALSRKLTYAIAVLFAALGAALSWPIITRVRAAEAAVRQSEEQIRLLNAGLEQKVKDRTRELLEAQEVLIRNEKLATLGQIAGSVGHELRNPLGVMSNAVFYLQTVLSEPTARPGVPRDHQERDLRLRADRVGVARRRPHHPTAHPAGPGGGADQEEPR